MSNDRTILHRDPPPEMAGGKMVILHEVRDITGAAIQEGTNNVALKLQTTSGDSVLLGLTPGGVDAMIETLTKIRAQLTEDGVEPTLSFQPVHTVQCGVHAHDGQAFVAMLIDRVLPSAAAYLMPPKNARLVAKQLIASAREASHARGEIIGLDET